MKRITYYLLIAIMTSILLVLPVTSRVASAENNFIKWVEMKMPYSVLKKAYDITVKYHYDENINFDFTEALAYISLKNGNNFNSKKDISNLYKMIAELKKGNTLNELYGNNKYYKYYLESYNAIFSEYVGEFEKNGDVSFGLKTFHPLANGYWYNHYDDFGNSRSFGFKRKHLGHDIFGSIGTPIVAIEGGTIVELGWNRYGGWRIGIRSDDTLRYYYYAHLRKDKPFAQGIEKGAKVKAGQVIGYLGVTGYSNIENKNMNANPHLHLGIQLIFDESQVDGNEIWIDCYAISQLLSNNRMSVTKDELTGHYTSNF